MFLTLLNFIIHKEYIYIFGKEKGNLINFFQYVFFILFNIILTNIHNFILTTSLSFKLLLQQLINDFITHLTFIQNFIYIVKINLIIVEIILKLL